MKWADAEDAQTADGFLGTVAGEPGFLLRTGQGERAPGSKREAEKGRLSWRKGHCLRRGVCKVCAWMCAWVLTVPSFTPREQEGKHTWECSCRGRTACWKLTHLFSLLFLPWLSLLSRRNCGRYVPWAGGEGVRAEEFQEASVSEKTACLFLS